MLLIIKVDLIWNNYCYVILDADAYIRDKVFVNDLTGWNLIGGFHVKGTI